MNVDTVGEERPTVFVLFGSLRIPSLTERATNLVCDELTSLGWAVDRCGGEQLNLPMADPDFHRNPQDHPNVLVKEMSKRVVAADAVVLASPVYHGSYSGVMKNLLDHLEWDAFRGLPVGLVAQGGSVMAGSSVCDHLRSIVRTMAGYSTQTQLITGRADFDSQDNPCAAVADRAARLAREIDSLARLLDRSGRLGHSKNV